MKKTIVMILTVILLCAAVSAFAENDGKHYLNENVYIIDVAEEAEIMASVYNGVVQTWDVSELFHFFQFDTSKPYVTDDRGYQLIITNDQEMLSVSAAEGNRSPEAFNIYYMNTEADAYSSLFQKQARYLSGLTQSTELKFMPEQEVINQCMNLLERLLPGVTPVCAEVWGYSADDLNTVKAWLLENDEMYAAFVESEKIKVPDVFGIDDEVYKMLFTFEIEGIPIFNCNEVGLTTYSENEKALAKEMYCDITFGQSGIIDFSLMNCAALGSESSRSRVISELDAADRAAKRYEDVIRTSPVVLRDACLEYMPLIQSDGRLQFVPTWYFCAVPENNPKLVIEACRINAITGDVIN